MAGTIADRPAAALSADFSWDAPTKLQLIQPVPDAIASFPQTRYYGSKRRLLGWMYSHLGAVRFDSVLDAFGGTGSVSLMFRAMRKRVTYHDGLLFNEDVGRSILADKPALSRGNVKALLDSVKPKAGVISQHFSEIFFKDEENSWLDGFFHLIDSEERSVEERSLLRYVIYQACLKKRPFNLFHRANIHLRTNLTVHRSFGNAVTWERSFTHHALQAYDDIVRRSVSNGSFSILPSGNAEDIAPGYDLVYIDPPYIGREERRNRDDYWRRYHFLEGLARYNEWEKLIDTKSNIRLFEPPSWFPEWASTRSFKDRLFSFIDRHQHSIVVLSYVSGAFPSEAEIKAHFEARFSQVSVHSAEHNHALSKARKRELLFIGYPR
ncbi:MULTISPECIES: DNA adenine methylase [unclassified Mesorhizobium]|uniref:DNA adenine methylase n=1 Tax=unclassified Mesorhizobium TaxID=325217 RepID=UPI000404ECB8|nr:MULTISPECIES: DNA adenine methylase [unclassified Mesorhizobium]